MGLFNQSPLVSIGKRLFSRGMAWGALVLLAWGGWGPARAGAAEANEAEAAAPVVAPAAGQSTAPAAGVALFQSGVRELLATRCLKCHGGEKTQGEFDLTTREGLLKGGSLGPAIVSGDASKSLLIKLVSHADEPAMPADEPQLADEHIAWLAAWINAGAGYDAPLSGALGPATPRPIPPERRDFWSFKRLAKHEPPRVSAGDWPRTEVDRFILAKQEAAGLGPSPVAERWRLIRRASLDLIGLPPTPDEVAAFVADSAPDAYERLIDRLLASPRHGERRARHWLDLARYAESHGFEQDDDRPNAYHYRDFVIRALNDDMPYDRFVRWQIAGDELAPAESDAWMATGFLAAGAHATQITANQAEKERYDELDDMVSTIGTSMLGLTIGCARCHDHKYDPIGQHDYYRLASVFTSTVRSNLDLDLDPHPAATRATRERWRGEHALLVAALAKFEAEELARRFESWLAGNPAPPSPAWLAPAIEAPISSGGAKWTAQPDGSWLATGPKPDFDSYTFTVRNVEGTLAHLRLEALADPSLPRQGPGRADNGNFALTDVRLSVTQGEGPTENRELRNARATHEQNGLPARATIDDDPKSGWAVDPRFGEDHAVAWDLATPLELDAETVLTVTLKFDNNLRHAIGRPRLSLAIPPRSPAISNSAAPARGSSRRRSRRPRCYMPMRWRFAPRSRSRPISAQKRIVTDLSPTTARPMAIGCGCGRRSTPITSRGPRRSTPWWRAKMFRRCGCARKGPTFIPTPSSSNVATSRKSKAPRRRVICECSRIRALAKTFGMRPRRSRKASRSPRRWTPNPPTPRISNPQVVAAPRSRGG